MTSRIMPSVKKYNLVQSDDLDSRVPLVPDEAFQHGITFNVKFIGAMDIPRPTSRVEIVAAMRRVRFEFKAKGIKKRKVTITVSTEGIRTFVRKKKPRGNKKNHTLPEIILESHPIYRIFYVSHDSQDVKIFSYIARETSSAVFKCVVFKALKKSQAMKIVRTVGQAFEVCHKISGPITDDEPQRNEGTKEINQLEEILVPTKKSLELTPKPTPKKIPPPINVEPDEQFERDVSESPQSPRDISSIHETKLLREKLELATQATNAALAQVNLLRDQIQVESNARVEAQARTHQLLQHNKELLDHLQSLVRHIQELEGNKQSLSSVSPTPLPQVSFQEIDTLRRHNAALLDTILYENNRHYPYCLYHMHPGSPGHSIPPSHSLNQLLVNPLLHHSVSVPQSSQSSSPTSKYYEDSFGTVFTSAGHPCEIIKPISDDASRTLRASGGEAGINKFGGNVQRSVSEKIGHRSELMSQVQRTGAWSSVHKNWSPL